PETVICRVGERDGVRKAGLLPLCCYETAVDPVINHPHADAVSLSNLADAECSVGKRRAGDAMLVADPTYHADRERFAGFFFFQAEDGIRDKLVTGVQTCALPIFAYRAGREVRVVAGDG